MDEKIESEPEESEPAKSGDNEPAPETSAGWTSFAIKIAVAIAVVAVIGGLWWYYLANAPEGKSLFDILAEQESTLEEWRDNNYVVTLLGAFVLYVLVTGFSLPGAAPMTIIYGKVFGFWVALPLVSFASSIGATIAFVLSRYLFGDWVKNKFSERISGFNKALEREGPFFLFSLRLIPAVPFFVINVAMAMTPIRVVTFYWVSQLGMLAGTIVYVYAGSTVPSLNEVRTDGFRSWQLFVAFLLLAAFPFVARWVMSIFRNKSTEEALEE